MSVEKNQLELPAGGGASGRGAAALALDNRARWAVMGAILLTTFLSSLDQTVVGTALPRIVTDLNGAGLYTWVVTGYLLSSTITGPIYGKLSDAFGSKPMLIIGVVIFLLGSALSGLAQNMTELVLFRCLQGLGAGAIFPIAIAIVGAMFSPRERGKYQGLFGAVFGLSFIVGPLIGGWITDNISWHWVFYVNLPLGLVALLVLATVLPAAPARRSSWRNLDYLGIALFSAGLVPLLIGLTNKGELSPQGSVYSWTDPNVGGLILLGLVLLGLFILAESKVAQPIVPLDLFRGRDYSASMAAVFLLGMAMFTAVIFMPRFYQAVRGVSATESGYFIWPLLLGLMGSSIASGQVISRSGRYKWLMLGSIAVLTVGAFSLTHLTAGVPDWELWAWLLLLGVGLGPSMAGFTIIVQSSVPLNRLGVATSTLTFLRQMGGSVGLALANTVFLSSFDRHLPIDLRQHHVPAPLLPGLVRLSGQLQGVGDLGAVLHHTLPASALPLVPAVLDAIKQAFASSVAGIFWITLVAALMGGTATALLRDRSLRSVPEVRAPSLERSETESRPAA